VKCSKRRQKKRALLKDKLLSFLATRRLFVQGFVCTEDCCAVEQLVPSTPGSSLAPGDQSPKWAR